jgi:hypothetical protein
VSCAHFSTASGDASTAISRTRIVPTAIAGKRAPFVPNEGGEPLPNKVLTRAATAACGYWRGARGEVA